MTRKRRKLEPHDMLEKTNIKQHNAIIGALNDLVDDYDQIDLMPGPKGEKGDKGDKGDPGPEGPPGIIENVTYESIQGLPEMLDAKADKTEVTAHAGRTDNPHSVTKALVGLGAYPTSPADIGISTATQTALDGTVKTTGNQNIDGVKVFNDHVSARQRIICGREGLESSTFIEMDGVGTEEAFCTRIKHRLRLDGTIRFVTAMSFWVDSLTAHTTLPMRSSPGSSDVVNTKYVLDQVAGMVDYVNAQDALKADEMVLLDSHTFNSILFNVGSRYEGKRIYVEVVYNYNKHEGHFTSSGSGVLQINTTSQMNSYSGQSGILVTMPDGLYRLAFRSVDDSASGIDCWLTWEKLTAINEWNQVEPVVDIKVDVYEMN